jgi:hypothetical protein
MSGVEHCMWFLWPLIGFFPYHMVGKKSKADGKSIDIRALYWSLLICSRPDGSRSWTMRFHLIERARNSLWAVAVRFRGDGPHED